MIALARWIGQHRKVNVFYGQPATHKGNAVFDHLRQVLFPSPTGSIAVVHDNRHGLAKAVNGLKNGEIVIIMPDVFQDEDATMMLPFCGRLMNVMLGTAAMARKTGSWILPAISRLHGTRLAFRTHFGTRVDHPLQASRLPARQIRACDYAVTRALFRQFEVVMRDELHLWQHVRGHFAGSTAMHLAGRDGISGILAAMENAPLFRAPDLVLDLSRAAAHAPCAGCAGDGDRPLST